MRKHVWSLAHVSIFAIIFTGCEPSVAPPEPESATAPVPAVVGKRVQVERDGPGGTVRMWGTVQPDGTITQGDMILGHVDDSSDGEEPDGVRRAHGSALQSWRWPNARIPYVISGAFGPWTQASITNNIALWNQQSVVQWVPSNPWLDPDIVFITPGNSCSSAVGRVGGAQTLTLTSACAVLSAKTLHEMGHATGLFHEQSRADRDDHVIVNFDNIPTAAHDNYEKTELTGTPAHDIGPYVDALPDLCILQRSDSLCGRRCKRGRYRRHQRRLHLRAGRTVSRRCRRDTPHVQGHMETLE